MHLMHSSIYISLRYYRSREAATLLLVRGSLTISWKNEKTSKRHILRATSKMRKAKLSLIATCSIDQQRSG